MPQYRKFIAAVIGAIVTILATQGVSVDPEIVTAVTTLLTAIAVLLIPNQTSIEFYNEDLNPKA
jgi:uncharacterized membrane protein (DUF441 family)